MTEKAGEEQTREVTFQLESTRRVYQTAKSGIVHGKDGDEKESA